MVHSSERGTAGDRRVSHLKPHSLLVSSECSQAVMMPQGPKRGEGLYSIPTPEDFIPMVEE